jgi:hypothetical protein
MHPATIFFVFAAGAALTYLFGVNTLRRLLQLRDHTTGLSWIADVVSMAFMTGGMVFDRDRLQENAIVLFFLVVPFFFGVTRALDSGCRMGTVVVQAGACGFVFALLAKAIATVYWLHLVPFGYSAVMTVAVLSTSDTEEWDVMLAKLGIALVYTTLWATSLMIANLMDISAGVCRLGVLVVVTISTSAPISLALLILIVAGGVIPPSVSVSYCTYMPGDNLLRRHRTACPNSLVGRYKSAVS